MENLVKLNLFGDLGDFVGANEWEFDVKSVSEAIQAVNTVTKQKFNDYFIKNNKLNAKYRILINGEDFIAPELELNEKNWELINSSELVMKKNNLKTIDIVPIIESSGVKGGGIFATIVGALLIVVGAVIAIVGSFVGAEGVGGMLIFAGLGILSAGVVALLSKPPVFDYSNQLDNASAQSYLFNGPQNTVGEGGPIPIGYGTLAVGSNVISAGYKITEFQNN